VVGGPEHAEELAAVGDPLSSADPRVPVHVHVEPHCRLHGVMARRGPKQPLELLARQLALVVSVLLERAPNEAENGLRHRLRGAQRRVQLHERLRHGPAAVPKILRSKHDLLRHRRFP